MLLERNEPGWHSRILAADSMYACRSCERMEGREGGVFSCKVAVSSHVWGRGVAVCGPHLYTPAGALAPFPAAARHTATPPGGHPAALEDCSSLDRERKVLQE